MIKKLLVCLFAIVAVASTASVDAQAAKPKAKASSTGKTDLVVGGIQLATAVIPLIGGLFKKKQCRQVACWVSTPTCFRDAAALVQNQVFQGRDGYSIESSGPTGAWVRYWRVRTGVSKDQVIASGKCEDGKKFEVFNCQQTQGKVHC